MKKLPPFLLACALAVPAFTQDAGKKAPPAKAEAPAATAASIPVTAAVVTAPLAVKDGVLSVPEMFDITNGGKAVFEFTVPKAGNYLVYGVVNAPTDDANSFYVNIDAMPAELMIWDIEVTRGFQERVVNWRGTGDAENGEFKPKVFALTAGAHKLILVGREPAELKSISIRPAN